jgi:SPP1 family phage portal protein
MSSIVANAERTLFGRRVIYTDETEITRENIASVINEAIPVHLLNSDEIQYLYDYYKGRQPILDRIKEVRKDINNKIVVNYANEIVSFKVGYLAGEPIQYVSHCERVNSEEVNTLNDFMFSENKAKKDQEIIEWGYICGTAFRYVKADVVSEMDESPFEIFTLDPRYTFVVYSSGIEHKPMIAVTYTVDKDCVKHYIAYTKDSVYSFTDTTDALPEKIADNGYNPIIPIFEYPANNARLGAFETVLPLLDAINRTESNRLDGIEQQIQAFLKFVNCDIDEDGLKAMHEYGAIKIKSDSANPADVELVSINFSQSDAQVSKEDLYNAVLTIVGMPVMGNGSDTISANNGAVLVNNGWSQAEARAKDSETMFKGAENEMLKLVLRICKTFTDKINLKSTDIDLKFTRRNYENIQSKAQVLCEMLNNPKIHPKLAFEHSGMFSDPETAYSMSEEYYQENLEKWNVEIVPSEDGTDVSNSGSVDSTS